MTSGTCIQIITKTLNKILQLFTVLNLSIVYFISSQDEDGDIIKSLLDTVRKLHMECLTLQEATKLQNKHQINTYISNVREHAYNIAKDAKQIITKYASQGSE